MDNSIKFRSFNNKDYKVVSEWWSFWWGDKGAIERKFLPHNDYCFMISIILNIEEHAKLQGIDFIFTVCGNVHMENIHKKLNWTIDKSAPAYETYKYI